jgi:hypothetical protein
MEMGERLRRALGSAEELASVLFDQSADVLLALLDNPRLSDEHLKVLLSRKDLHVDFLQELGTRERLLHSYEVKLALVRHPHVPRSVSLVLLRHLYTFDLLRVAATPSSTPEVRRVAEESLAARAPFLSLGERIAMARQASARLAAAMLTDPVEEVFRVALENRRLTEEGVVRALRDSRITAAAVEAIRCHPRWAARYEVRMAIVRSPGASLACVLKTVGQVSSRDLAELCGDPAMPLDRRQYLARVVARRPPRQRGGGTALAAGPAQGSTL